MVSYSCLAFKKSVFVPLCYYAAVTGKIRASAFAFVQQADMQLKSRMVFSISYRQSYYPSKWSVHGSPVNGN
jgi:hypothetical protein